MSRDLDQLNLQLAMLDYIAAHQWIAFCVGLSKRLAIVLGCPFVIAGVLAGNFFLVRLGVFMWLVHLMLLGAAILVLVPGLIRIMREQR
jgi:hypothetical protein